MPQPQARNKRHQQQALLPQHAFRARQPQQFVQTCCAGRIRYARLPDAPIRAAKQLLYLRYNRFQAIVIVQVEQNATNSCDVRAGERHFGHGGLSRPYHTGNENTRITRRSNHGLAEHPRHLSRHRRAGARGSTSGTGSTRRTGFAPPHAPGGPSAAQRRAAARRG